MKTIIAISFWSLSIIWSLTCTGQSDTTILAYNEYLENLLTYHPLAKKAELRMVLAQAERLAARGNLDPKLSSGWSQKNFDDKLYYRLYKAKLRFPTPLGVSVVSGYENTEGVFLNPEAKTDKRGLWHIGLEVDILQGLWINPRRTALQQAKIFQNLAQNQQRIMLNDLIYNASATYLLWQQYAYFKTILLENITIANTYFQNTKESFFNGEKTGLDTLEAFILYQDALAFLQKNELGLAKVRQTVENYLWFQDQPLELQANIQPEIYQNQLFTIPIGLDEVDVNQHPIILASINKLSTLELSQKLKREKLKPKLKLKYNPLLATSKTNITPNYSADDYKWGFNFSIPILLRTERGNIQKGNIKIQETKLDLQNKRNQLQNKIENSWFQQRLLQDQLTLLNRNVISYKQLLDGETEKFNFGESSVFLLNKRREKYINGQLKLIKTFINRQLELLNFLYYSNQLLD